MTLECSQKRYRTGRKIMLTSAAIYALSRALAYLPNPNIELPQALKLITTIVPIWVWAGLWLVAMVLCLIDLFRGVGRKGISSVVGLMLVWGTAYGISYVSTVYSMGWGSREWLTFYTYVCGAGIIQGLLMKVGSLKPVGTDE